MKCLPAALGDAAELSSASALIVRTTASHFTLPSTAELGLGTVATGTAFQWDVFGFGGDGFTTVDDVVGPNASVEPIHSWSGESQERSFTTQ